jgi:hypothetical protein
VRLRFLPFSLRVLRARSGTDGDPLGRTGTTYEGIYRKTGGMGQTKLITQYFERGQDFDLQDRDKFNDLAAITSCMKNYFRTLPVPLFTHDLHEEFVSAAGAFPFSFFVFFSKNLTGSNFDLQKLPKEKDVSKRSKRRCTSCHPSTSTPPVFSSSTSTSSSQPPFLPPFLPLTFLLHCYSIKSLAAENKMTSANLGVVFGRASSFLLVSLPVDAYTPISRTATVLRSPVAAREWSDMGPKAKIVEILCDHAESLFARPYSSP